MNVLIVDRPGAFRDALVSAMRARGAAVHASDGALEALGKLRELAPRLIVVSDASGPPDVASTARLVRRQLGDVPVYHLHDPALGGSAPDTVSLSRHDDVGELARALIGDGAPADARPVAVEEPIDELVEVVTEHEDASARPLPPPPPPAGLPPAKQLAPKLAAPVAMPQAAPEPPAAPAPASAPSPDDADARLLSEIEPLVHQGRWQDLVDLVGKREPDPQRLSPRTALLYAVALKEAPAAATGAGPRPTVDPDLLGVRAVAALLRMDGQSTTALMIAKRVLRKRPLEWQREPPRRVSVVITLVALALGAAAGLVFDQHLMALLFR